MSNEPTGGNDARLWKLELPGRPAVELPPTEWARAFARWIMKSSGREILEQWERYWDRVNQLPFDIVSHLVRISLKKTRATANEERFAS